MLRGTTVKLYPTQSQKIEIEKNIGSARWVYNHMIHICQKRYHRTGKVMSGYDMQAMLPKLKKQYPWLSEPNSQSLQIVCHNLGDAYGKFFKKKTRFPVKKKKHDGNSYTSVTNVFIDSNRIRIPKLGLVKFRGGDLPDGRFRRVTIKTISGKYYASILVDTKETTEEIKDFNIITGIDLGLIDMVTCSHGDTFKAHKSYKKSKEKLSTAQKSFARKVKGSARQKKAKIIVSRIHEKIKNQRKDVNHKITRILINDSENQAFAIEDLAVKNMMKNHKLASAISDAAWGQFLIFLKYKAKAVGKPVLEVDRWYPSSKTCSVCGLVNKNLTLSNRVWTCDCGQVHHRDINAARNIALEAARNVAHGDSVKPRLALVSVNEV